MPADVPLAASPAAVLTRQCRELWPDRPPPVAVARVNHIPPSVEEHCGPAVSACQLWREATERVFAVGADHGACPIGRVTQGFAAGLPDGDPLLSAMLAGGYIDLAEVGAMPALPMGHAAMVYGPLDRFPVVPEAALVFALPEQAMLLTEGLGLSRLDRPALEVLGRPTCAALAAAIGSGAAKGSLACTGARLFAGMEPGELLLVIPGGLLAPLAEALPRTVAANRTVAALDATLRRVVMGPRD